LGDRLIAIHGQIRQQTSTLRQAISDVKTGVGTRQAAQTALESLSIGQKNPGLGSLCTGYCELLTVHHTMEDHRVFPGLGKTHLNLRGILEQLFREHEVVAALIERLRKGLAEASNRTGLRKLDEVAQCLAEQLDSHLAYEEAQLFEVLNATPA
jgi:hypothetical protein